MTRQLLAGAASAALLGAFASSATAQSVTFATVDWAPYYHSELPEKGFVSALTKEAFARNGYDFSVEFMPFSRAMKSAKNGTFDGVLGAWYNEERDQDFEFSEPIVDTANVLMAQNEVDIDSYDSLEDLQGYSIAVSRGWAYGGGFDEADFLDKEVADDQIQNMRKLFRGRVDMMAVEQRVFAYEARQRDSFDLAAVKAVQPPLSETPIYNIVPNGHDNQAELIEAFNSGLQELRDDGTYDEILARLNQDV